MAMDWKINGRQRIERLGFWVTAEMLRLPKWKGHRNRVRARDLGNEIFCE